jgi:hypothetical protein
MIIGGLGKDVGVDMIALVKLRDEASSGGGYLYAGVLVSPFDSTKVLLRSSGGLQESSIGQAGYGWQVTSGWG